jgi:dimethylhistidine N-methyltransferase
LLKQWSNEIGKAIPGSAVVVEFGSGSSRKTELLLSALNRPCAYIPIEISAAALYPAARRIAEDFPEISVHPILGGFHDLKKIRLPLRDYPYLGFFPGSTIGNLTRAESILFLKSARQLLGGDASFLIGVDLKKPLDILLPAYDDAQGVTAAFNCNVLTRINRELDGTFDLSAFDHQAIYNESEGRIEMHLRSKCVQAASVGGHVFQFQSGETIHTENSYKYTVAEFHALAQESDWSPIKTWIDKNSLFSLHLLA